jgi:hypothetical protein
MELLEIYEGPNPMALERSRKALMDHIGKTMPLEAEIFESLGAKEHQFLSVPVPTARELDSTNDPHGLKKAIYLAAEKSRQTQKDTYEMNMKKVFRIIWAHLSLGLQQRVMEHGDYDRINKDKETYELWKVVCNLVLSGSRVTSGASNDVLISQGKERMALLRQGRNESVAKFFERYIAECEALKTAGAQIEKESTRAIEFWNKLDDSRFGGAKTELRNDLTKGHNNYPTTVIAMKNMAESLKREVEKVGANGATYTQTVFLASHYESKGGGGKKGNNNSKDDKGKRNNNKNKKGDTSSGATTTERSIDVPTPICKYICPLAPTIGFR